MITTISGALFYYTRYGLELLRVKELTLTKIMDIREQLLDGFSIWLQETRGIKAITINTYIRHVVPILRYGMELGYIRQFTYKQLKQDILIKEIYSDSEFAILLAKPSMNSFAEYRNWVIVNFLLATGVRAKELRYIKIKNINFENEMIILEKAKNRKQRREAYWFTTLSGVWRSEERSGRTD